MYLKQNQTYVAGAFQGLGLVWEYQVSPLLPHWRQTVGTGKIQLALDQLLWLLGHQDLCPHLMLSSLNHCQNLFKRKMFKFQENIELMIIFNKYIINDSFPKLLIFKAHSIRIHNQLSKQSLKSVKSIIDVMPFILNSCS